MKVKKMPNIEICKSCYTCKHYGGAKRLSGFCSKHDITVAQEQICNDYVDGVSTKHKAGTTMVFKTNIKIAVSDAFKTSKEVIAIDKDVLLSWAKKDKRKIKEALESFNDTLYVTKKGYGYFIVDRDLSYDDIMLLSEKQNILNNIYGARDAIQETLDDYIYHTYS